MHLSVDTYPHTNTRVCRYSTNQEWRTCHNQGRSVYANSAELVSVDSRYTPGARTIDIVTLGVLILLSMVCYGCGLRGISSWSFVAVHNDNQLLQN